MILINVPNVITMSRIILIPLIIGLYYLPSDWLSLENKNLAATAVFILAAVTDWLDGYMARRLNQMSAFGAFLDPVADKLIVVGALVVLLYLGRVDALVALIVIGREIAISALREWMAQIGASKSVAVNQLGKVKTACQMVAIPMLLYSGPLQFGAGGFVIDTRVWGLWLIYLAAILTIWSMLYYMKLAWPQIRERGGIV